MNSLPGLNREAIVEIVCADVLCSVWVAYRICGEAAQRRSLGKSECRCVERQLGRASEVESKDEAQHLGRQRRVKRVTVLETEAGLWRWRGRWGKSAG